MEEMKQQKIATDDLLVGNFNKAGPVVDQLSDPLVDTPMVVTLDQLKTYELDPRIVRNPRYDEIKDSIRERGLDAPPAITRRPGDEHFIIRNGGNTRLSVLRELWSETKNERFFRINCLFRPWQNDIVALTGHLVENELHGQLTFIERALGVSKFKEIYEQDSGEKLTQAKLAKILTEYGYPMSQSLVSLMQETTTVLLSAMPNILYSGFSRKQAERLVRLRRSAKLAFERHIDQLSTDNFIELFFDILSLFDEAGELDFNRFQDELTSRMAKVCNCTYNLIALELSEKDTRQQLIETLPVQELEINESELFNKDNGADRKPESEISEREILETPLPVVTKTEPAVKVTRSTKNTEHDDQQAFIAEHIVSPVESTPRLEAIEDMVAEFTGEAQPDFSGNVIQSIPVSAGGLYPISDIWIINPNLDNPEQLRVHIGQLAMEIADELGIADYIETHESGIGFRLNNEVTDKSGQSLFTLLEALAGNVNINKDVKLNKLAALLTGTHIFSSEVTRLSDVAFVKLIRILRLTRRFWELTTN